MTMEGKGYQILQCVLYIFTQDAFDIRLNKVFLLMLDCFSFKGVKNCIGTKVYSDGESGPPRISVTEYALASSLYGIIILFM